MNILVLNCGSSSLKFQLIATDLERIEHNDDKRLAHGTIERIGGAAIITLTAEGQISQRSAAPIRDMRSAVETIVRWMVSDDSGIEGMNGLADIQAVGHRVVHGGERFTESVIISDEILRGIEDCIELAPLHNPANISGILAAREIFGKGITQVAVFDTAFHQTLPERSFLYALPYQLYRRHKIRRYGFHGTSNRYVSYRYRTLLNISREQVNVISLHLGNGCSATAIKGGNSLDTSMGMTPVEGLVMGTRAGDFDPAIIDFIAAKEGLSALEIESLINKQSGLLGVSGLTNDMRELLAEAKENGDRRSRLAIELFCYRASKYIGSYLAAMNGSDAIIFTGGIGENSPEVRRLICENLAWFGVELDQNSNESTFDGLEGTISTDGSRIRVVVIPTNEELLIARDTVRLITSRNSKA
ncbi:MAG: acetate kinase [bacterium]|nr:acetate kinase [bacterium]